MTLTNVLLQDKNAFVGSIATCSKISKTTNEEAKELSRLFPSSSSQLSKKRGPSFDPSEALDGLPDAKKKKKGKTSQGRTVKVSICRLPRFTPFIPKGKVRSLLKQQGRILNIQLTRSMSGTSVRQVINRAYTRFSTDWLYLELTGPDSHLMIAKEQSPDGDTICTRRGSLYIFDKQVRPLHLQIGMC